LNAYESVIRRSFDQSHCIWS